MRKPRTVAILGVLALLLSSCGDGDDEVISTFVAQTLSNQVADGDIAFSPDPERNGTYTISQANATDNVLFGVDADGTEFRAFLDFPLDGSNGGDAIPLGAVILSADIEVFVNGVALVSTAPTLLDLVPFPRNGLTRTDFDSDPIVSRSPFDVLRSDINAFVLIDVTPLMAEAHSRGQLDLQVRFLLDFGASSGLVEIYDGDAFSKAPLLTVEYQ